MEGASADQRVDRGVLLLRVGLGIMFVAFHGGPKLFGGPAVWAKVGMAMGQLGIHAVPAFWGFLAACAEFFGGLCLLLGLFTRSAALFMAMTMAVAAIMHLSQGDSIAVASHAIEDGVVFLSLILIGAGSYSLDRRWFGRRTEQTPRYTLP
jgi:putative oxidoreductase